MSTKNLNQYSNEKIIRSLLCTYQLMKIPDNSPDPWDIRLQLPMCEEEIKTVVYKTTLKQETLSAKNHKSNECDQDTDSEDLCIINIKERLCWKLS
jgi:hypothetical protein